jgi:hypothetical protein
MNRRLDIEALDAALERLGVDLADDVECGTDAEVGEWSPGAEGPSSQEWWAAAYDPDAGGGRRSGADSHRLEAYARPTRRVRHRRSGLRPRGLPPLVIPPGYRRDNRGTWRYDDGTSVPGARDVTIATLWRLDGDPVVVPDDLVRCAAELAWCADVGVSTETFVGGGRRKVAVAAWSVEREDWDDHAHWPLTLEAPELSAVRLWGVADVAEWLAVSPSTVTAYLSRGLLPQPQVRIGGRPGWSVAILLRWRRRVR